MDNVFTIDDFRKEQKKREFKDKVISKINSGREFIVRNKETIITLTPVVITGITTVSKVVNKRINLRKEENLKDLYCYD